MNTSPIAAADLVSTFDLTKRYGDHTAVSELNLRVPEGGIYGFLGPNGSGKSTTMKLLLGLISPDAGRMLVLGREVDRRRPLPPGSIGSLIEGPSYYPNLTGKENLQMLADYLGVPGNRVDHVLAVVGLSEASSKRAKHYSLGMKQRLGLAMALLPEPRLLLLDEPTNGLDPAGVAEIRELIVALSREQGITTIVSSHILSEIEHMADTVGIILNGQLRYQGPLSGLHDEGTIEFRLSNPAAARVIFEAAGVPYALEAGVVRVPMMEDTRAARLTADLFRNGQEIYRVQTVRKTLEQAFLELTDPATLAPPAPEKHTFFAPFTIAQPSSATRPSHTAVFGGTQ